MANERRQRAAGLVGRVIDKMLDKAEQEDPVDTLRRADRVQAQSVGELEQQLVEAMTSRKQAEWDVLEANKRIEKLRVLAQAAADQGRNDLLSQMAPTVERAVRALQRAAEHLDTFDVMVNDLQAQTVRESEALAEQRDATIEQAQQYAADKALNRLHERRAGLGTASERRALDVGGAREAIRREAAKRAVLQEGQAAGLVPGMTDADRLDSWERQLGSGSDAGDRIAQALHQARLLGAPLGLPSPADDRLALTDGRGSRRQRDEEVDADEGVGDVRGALETGAPEADGTREPDMSQHPWHGSMKRGLPQRGGPAAKGAPDMGGLGD